MCLCTTYGACRGRKKRASDSLGLELHTLVGTVWVLGSELRSSTRTTGTLNCLTNSPALELWLDFCLLYGTVVP